MVLLNGPSLDETNQPQTQTISPKESAKESIGFERGSYNENSAFNLYLSEVATTRLLTPEEEIELAARIKAGDEEAVQLMIKANLRLVIKIAHDYEHFGLPLLDLINEGNIGLMKAVKRFDPSKGGKLSTYGAWWIKQSIKRALSDQSKTIRLPVHVVEKLSKIRRASTKLEAALGHEPTDEDLATELKMPARRVGELLTASAPPISLDTPTRDGDGSSLAELVADESSRTPLDELELETVKARLAQALERLSSRERDILRYRYGLDGGTEKTLDEVGEHFNISRERVRQLQNAALVKLRRELAPLELEAQEELPPAPPPTFNVLLSGKRQNTLRENRLNSRRSAGRR